MSTTVIMHGPEEANPRIRVRVDKDEPRTSPHHRVDHGVEGVTRTFNDALKTRVTIHAEHQGPSDDPLNTRVLIDSPDVEMQLPPGVEPPAEHVKAELERELLYLHQKRKAIMAREREVRKQLEGTAPAPPAAPPRVIDAPVSNVDHLAGEIPAKAAEPSEEGEGGEGESSDAPAEPTVKDLNE